MTAVQAGPPEARIIGSINGVRIEVAPCDAVTADVALAVAGVFTHEVDNAALAGGLKHLNDALGGTLLLLRANGVFQGLPGELLTLSAPPSPIRASAVLLVGLGDPGDWTPARMRMVLGAATREALRVGVPSAAFAPGLLDSGLAPARLKDVAASMLSGFVDGLSHTPVAGMQLKRWVFCSGATHLDESARGFAAAFEQTQGDPIEPS